MIWAQNIICSFDLVTVRPFQKGIKKLLYAKSNKFRYKSQQNNDQRNEKKTVWRVEKIVASVRSEWIYAPIYLTVYVRIGERTVKRRGKGSNKEERTFSAMAHSHTNVSLTNQTQTYTDTGKNTITVLQISLSALHLVSSFFFLTFGWLTSGQRLIYIDNSYQSANTATYVQLWYCCCCCLFSCLSSSVHLSFIISFLVFFNSPNFFLHPMADV